MLLLDRLTLLLGEAAPDADAFVVLQRVPAALLQNWALGADRLRTVVPGGLCLAGALAVLCVEHGCHRLGVVRVTKGTQSPESPAPDPNQGLELGDESFLAHCHVNLIP